MGRQIEGSLRIIHVFLGIFIIFIDECLFLGGLLLFLFMFFETRFLCVTALAVLELSL